MDPPPTAPEIPAPLGIPAILDAPRESTSNRKACNEFEAQMILERIPFFREFELVMPGLMRNLAKVAKVQYASKDEVIFRQGDPSIDCYSIMRGAVRTYIRQDGRQRSPRSLAASKAVPRKPLDHSVSHIDLQSPSRLRCSLSFCCCRRSTPVAAPIEPKRYLTAEGYNTYSKRSDLGKKRVDLHVGDLFGELGLMNDQPRSASIQCLEPCKFLVVPKHEFVDMFASRLKNHANTKYSFFHDNVPGFHSWATENLVTTHEDARGKIVFSRDKHPADAFEETTEVKGHQFLTEGKVAEPTIVVVKKGEVAFFRKTVVLPRKVSQAKEDCRLFQTREPHKKWERSHQVWQVLGDGQIFCSLQMFGLPFVEPFSAEVMSEECSVFSVSGASLQRIPLRILNAIKAHTTSTMKPLLWRSPAFVSVFSMPTQLEENDADLVL